MHHTHTTADGAAVERSYFLLLVCIIPVKCLLRSDQSVCRATRRGKKSFNVLISFSSTLSGLPGKLIFHTSNCTEAFLFASVHWNKCAPPPPTHRFRWTLLSAAVKYFPYCRFGFCPSKSWWNFTVPCHEKRPDHLSLFQLFFFFFGDCILVWSTFERLNLHTRTPQCCLRFQKMPFKIRLLFNIFIHYYVSR